MLNNKFLKASFAILIFIAVSKLAFSQKTEINVNVYSGLFNLMGKGATSTSAVFINSYSAPANYTINPLGKKAGFSYAIEGQIQRKATSSILYGMGFGFEMLESRVAIDSLFENGIILNRYPATGHTKLKSTSISVNPYISKRFKTGNLTFDIQTGADAAFNISREEEAEVSYNNRSISFTNKINDPVIDIRPRLQIKTQLKNYGLIVGYSLGVTNYEKDNNRQVTSSFLRLGLSYQIK